MSAVVPLLHAFSARWPAHRRVGAIATRAVPGHVIGEELVIAIQTLADLRPKDRVERADPGVTYGPEDPAADRPYWADG